MTKEEILAALTSGDEVAMARAVVDDDNRRSQEDIKDAKAFRQSADEFLASEDSLGVADKMIVGSTLCRLAAHEAAADVLRGELNRVLAKVCPQVLPVPARFKADKAMLAYVVRVVNALKGA